MKTIAFFNNKGGVGKTSLVYHLASMFHELGVRVLAADLDPQSNLTSAFLTDEELEGLWAVGDHGFTIQGALQNIGEGLGDIVPVTPMRIESGLHLLPGDMALGRFEDRLSSAWGACLDDNASTAREAFRATTALYRVIARAASDCKASICLIDVGPNVGALNRAALVAADYIVIPLGADLFSLQGLRNLGPTLKQWRKGWTNRRASDQVPPDLLLPSGNMSPLGYVLLNPSVRGNRPVKSYLRWAERIPGVYMTDILGMSDTVSPPRSDDDPNRLAMIKHFKSLMPMAQDARKPMFLLNAHDGAIGGHGAAVSDCFDQFSALAKRILNAVNRTP